MSKKIIQFPERKQPALVRLEEHVRILSPEEKETAVYIFSMYLALLTPHFDGATKESLRIDVEEHGFTKLFELADLAVKAYDEED